MKSIFILAIVLGLGAAQRFSIPSGFISFGAPVARPAARPASRPAIRPQPSFGRPRPSFVSAPIAPVAAPRAPASSSPQIGNYDFEGKRYLLSWRDGRSKLSFSAGSSYCRGKGMRLISLDSSSKINHFFNLLQNERIEYFWTGGSISRDKNSVTWENGRREGIRRGVFPWSDKGSRGPQPDGVNSENCLAILKNVYNDGVKFHDVGCHFEKPVICEEA
eukprot:TRINITY_DN365_c0_g1_i1.p1 TRINITY_DN365_c0_g1~~TRINITY_DN365_c0_g1_i1.p1  ORF type:complete len:219 (+),score=60.50 TRINITY_DN365_c0_g1_i1:132-788(+)